MWVPFFGSETIGFLIHDTCDWFGRGASRAVSAGLFCDERGRNLLPAPLDDEGGAHLAVDNELLALELGVAGASTVAADGDRSNAGDSGDANGHGRVSGGRGILGRG